MLPCIAPSHVTVFSEERDYIPLKRFFVVERKFVAAYAVWFCERRCTGCFSIRYQYENTGYLVGHWLQDIQSHQIVTILYKIGMNLYFCLPLSCSTIFHFSSN